MRRDCLALMMSPGRVDVPFYVPLGLVVLGLVEEICRVILFSIREYISLLFPLGE